jgi:hypothetical protein
MCGVLVFGVPLTRAVEFRAVLQKGNRFQVPKVIRWEFKMETNQVLRVRVGRANGYDHEYFFGRMNRDGRRSRSLRWVFFRMGLMEKAWWAVYWMSSSDRFRPMLSAFR